MLDGYNVAWTKTSIDGSANVTTRENEVDIFFLFDSYVDQLQRPLKEFGERRREGVQYVLDLGPQPVGSLSVAVATMQLNSREPTTVKDLGHWQTMRPIGGVLNEKSVLNEKGNRVKEWG